MSYIFRSSLRSVTIAFGLLIAATLPLLAPSYAIAHEFKVGSLVIGHPWSRATPPGAQVAGGYLTITNTGTEADRLISGTSSFSKMVEFHEMKMENDIMKMAELANGLEIKPGETVELKPGGLHIMFMGLTTRLKEGDMVTGTLVFEKAGTVDVEYKIDAIGAKDSGAKGKTKHDHSKM